MNCKLKWAQGFWACFGHVDPSMMTSQPLNGWKARFKIFGDRFRHRGRHPKQKIRSWSVYWEVYCQGEGGILWYCVCIYIYTYKYYTYIYRYIYIYNYIYISIHNYDNIRDAVWASISAILTESFVLLHGRNVKWWWFFDSVFREALWNQTVPEDGR